MDLNHPFERGLGQNPANHVPLSPLSFVARVANAHRDHPAVVYGGIRLSWGEFYRRCRRLASALVSRGVGSGDTVAVMLPNVPAMVEAHFGIPMAGAVLNALNVRLDADAIAYMLGHGRARVLITDPEFAPTIARALRQLDDPPLVIDAEDPQGPGGELLGTMTYENMLAAGDPDFQWQLPDDEWRAISLNYTSGTTGKPKGVVYHHRGAFLTALGNVLAWGGMGPQPVYLWTLPMFHCNGWCFPWTLAAVAGTSVCLRQVRVEALYEAVRRERVTHLCGAPVVLGLLLNAPPALAEGIDHPMQVMTAAAAPPAAVLERMAQRGFHITHVYGLTETYGPAVVCDWHREWDALPAAEQARLKARQGVVYPVQEGLVVADPETLEPVPHDGRTIGEIFMRGNQVMKGYLGNPDATAEAFADGWFHTGDLAVCHPDGYVEIKDRSKDIIISGGENISSIEVEGVLYRHPAVLEAAVVARPHPTWGETPCAFVTLKQGARVTADEIIAFCRERLAHFKCPTTVEFRELPRTATGKIQKFILRAWARDAG